MAKKYIDADKLAIDLQHRCDVVCPYTKAQRDVMCRACLLGDAIDTVEDQTAVDIPRWIPVTERLPEKYGQYLVTFIPSGGTLWTKVLIARYSDLMGIAKPSFHIGEVGKNSFVNINEQVIAWMPLPEPYKGGEGE